MFTSIFDTAYAHTDFWFFKYKAICVQDLFVCLSVEGGELFDRIIDENYKLTELDTVLFIRQITEGLQYMHKMYILHLDLKVTHTPAKY